MVAALLILIGLSAYYQSIRNNLAHETIASDVLSQDPSRFVHGFARFFIPQVDSTNGTEAAEFLRTGPLDFFLKVVDVVTNQDESSGGESTLFSIEMAVPKALYPGEKPVGDVDEVTLK